jgi:hypothetical protein
MEKAFDLQALKMKLDKAGVPVAEDLIQIAVNSFLDWVQESAVLTENKYDDAAVLLIPMIKQMIAPAIDQIDGKQGQ